MNKTIEELIKENEYLIKENEHLETENELLIKEFSFLGANEKLLKEMLAPENQELLVLIIKAKLCKSEPNEYSLACDNIRNVLHKMFPEPKTRINRIKKFRDVSGVSLKDSKEFVVDEVNNIKWSY